MLKQYRNYLIDYYLNQKIYSMFLYSIENYALFIEFNESHKQVGYRISSNGKYKFKKTNITIDFQKFNNLQVFSTMYQILKYLEEMHRILQVYSSKKCVQGYIIDLSEDYLLFQLIDTDTTKNGIMIIPIDYIDSIFWDREGETRLEKLVPYSKGNMRIGNVIDFYSKGKGLCEVYHSGFQSFILGRCFKITDDYYLIESLNLSDTVEGFVLIHKGLIDYICMQTKYVETYHTPEDNLATSFSNLTDFFKYVIHNDLKFDITTERKKIYMDCSLISYDDEKIIVKLPRKRKTLVINKIDIFDTCEK